MIKVLPKFDKYTLYARLFPAIIAAAPAIAWAWTVIASKELRLVQAIAGTALAVLLMVFVDVARRRGKAIEPRLVEQMGGLPSITMLRHRDTTFDAAAKARMHAFLAEKLAEPAPTAEQETNAPEIADDFYMRAGNWLRENTRSRKKFGILFNESITYGYRRNLFALKRPALILNILIVVGSALYLWVQQGPLDLLPVFVIAFLHAAYLAIFSTRSAVEDGVPHLRTPATAELGSSITSQAAAGDRQTAHSQEES
ncbi:hypothetical protein J4G48_0049270 (plasmid) [Bradyrhizobium barranii subsp. apii]|uniref:hypothetical protein n=1 Tax=Bradyrhizobium barranii TaxID=2992140 RepID=UPI001AA18DB4|nr:hypothetical protein [Bradyrhizobium barranii]UPU01397.1 hypothetical protein J4G48_0049270 [Bradyrhizobium barranii subsp. apii]